MTIVDPSSSQGQEIIRDAETMVPTTQGDPPPEADREEIGKLNTLATEEWADKIACQQELETARADVARLRHLAHQLIEDWRKNSQDKVSPYGRLLSPWAQDAFTECADELAAALTEPHA